MTLTHLDRFAGTDLFTLTERTRTFAAHVAGTEYTTTEMAAPLADLVIWMRQQATAPHDAETTDTGIRLSFPTTDDPRRIIELELLR